ncbi:MAG: 2-succinyl-5-enolpyruvyl-6-hydroxy-3-cyclohexene-1-carboxylic-acid synthase [Odoribacteraceae bacterium]|jgi:2-succinyl-5-enolpyruvyl-6-hydroxy-3-cyclohexene-1-carboxylate synthase|nr:2-succinyl-5-enolpyruvyl-6-hydroxy-3-cyclohexene-1-carboxylic-acid synthase [Odoribacteraceae bacterium]
MTTGSDIAIARLLVETLEGRGVTTAVLSPGSRNAPLTVTVARSAVMTRHVVVDERSAAFFALGLARQRGEAVALVCTSGTALLGYAPAVAEAFYQGVPLVVISADRPPEWIDQDDGQTIRQRGALSNVVKGAFELPVGEGEAECRHARRLLNEAVSLAREGMPGPVHVNVPLREPLYGFSPRPPLSSPPVTPAGTEWRLAEAEAARLRERLAGSPSVVVLAGFMSPDDELAGCLARLSASGRAVVLADALANLPATGSVDAVDRLLSTLDADARAALEPEVLVSIGGALVSRQLKSLARGWTRAEQWRVGRRLSPPDAFCRLSMSARLSPSVFFRQLEGDGWPVAPTNYAARWEEARAVASSRHEAALATLPWCDLVAFSLILTAIPAGSLLHLGNSTPARYAQLFEQPAATRVDGNRGTSGIEGATSTAVGAAVASGRLTVLVTGDLAFLYDSNALWCLPSPPNLRVIVMLNGGGGIFRLLPGSSGLAEVRELFETPHGVDVAALARLHGFAVVEVADAAALSAALPSFLAPSDRPSALVVRTEGRPNGELLNRYFKSLI